MRSNTSKIILLIVFVLFIVSCTDSKSHNQGIGDNFQSNLIIIDESEVIKLPERNHIPDIEEELGEIYIDEFLYATQSVTNKFHNSLSDIKIIVDGVTYYKYLVGMDSKDDFKAFFSEWVYAPRLDMLLEVCLITKEIIEIDGSLYKRVNDYYQKEVGDIVIEKIDYSEQDNISASVDNMEGYKILTVDYSNNNDSMYQRFIYHDDFGWQILLKEIKNLPSLYIGQKSKESPKDLSYENVKVILTEVLEFGVVLSNIRNETFEEIFDKYSYSKIEYEPFIDSNLTIEELFEELSYYVQIPIRTK